VRGHIEDDSAMVEEIPFRLLLIMLMISLSVYAASSGLARLAESRAVVGLESEMDEFVRVGIAVMASGEGTRVGYTLDLATGGSVSVESLIIGGDVDDPEGIDASRYWFRLSDGEETLRTLSSGSALIKASNREGEGFPAIRSNGEELIHMVSVECKGGMMLVLLQETDSFTPDDISEFKDINGCNSG
jgi:hypothetical protein